MEKLASSRLTLGQLLDTLMVDKSLENLVACKTEHVPSPAASTFSNRSSPLSVDLTGLTDSEDDAASSVSEEEASDVEPAFRFNFKLSKTELASETTIARKRSPEKPLDAMVAECFASELLKLSEKLPAPPPLLLKSTSNSCVEKRESCGPLIETTAKSILTKKNNKGPKERTVQKVVQKVELPPKPNVTISEKETNLNALGLMRSGGMANRVRTSELI